MNKLAALAAAFLLAVSPASQAEEGGGPLADILKETDPQVFITEMKNLLPDVSSDNLRQGLALLAVVEELFGSLDEARQHYLQAAFAGSGERDVPYMLHSAELLIELGGLEEAGTICKAVLNTADDPGLKESASVLTSRIAFLEGSAAQAWAALEPHVLPMKENISAPALYWVYRLADLSNRDEEKAAAAQSIRTKYPGSPEQLLIDGGAKEYPSPLTFFGLLETHTAFTKQVEPAEEPPSQTDTPHDEEPRNIMIQTGSFTDRENAEYHVKDLSAEGFSAEIVTKTISGKVYHRVVIPDVPADESQEYLMRLKDRGYEGWPLYD